MQRPFPLRASAIATLLVHSTQKESVRTCKRYDAVRHLQVGLLRHAVWAHIGATERQSHHARPQTCPPAAAVRRRRAPRGRAAPKCSTNDSTLKFCWVPHRTGYGAGDEGQGQGVAGRAAWDGCRRAAMRASTAATGGTHTGAVEARTSMLHIRTHNVMSLRQHKYAAQEDASQGYPCHQRQGMPLL